jgi:hypothetical protein
MEAPERETVNFKELYQEQSGREWRISDPIIINLFGEMIGYAHDTYPDGEVSVGWKIVEGKLEMVNRVFTPNEIEDDETGGD